MDGVVGVAQVFLSMLAPGLAAVQALLHLYGGGIFNVFKTLCVSETRSGSRRLCLTTLTQKTEAGNVRELAGETTNRTNWKRKTYE